MNQPTQASLRVFRLLQVEPQTISEVCERLDLSETAVRKHLRTLTRAGLVARQRGSSTGGRPAYHYIATSDLPDKDKEGPVSIFFELLSKDEFSPTAHKLLEAVTTMILSNMDDLENLSPREKIDFGLRELRKYWSDVDYRESSRSAVIDLGPCALKTLRDATPHMQCPCFSVLDRIFAKEISAGTVDLSKDDDCNFKIRF